MPTLTLTPSRYAPADSWPLGAFAYAYPDRYVAVLGESLIRDPILAVSGEQGTLALDLVANEKVDEALPFKWVIVALNERSHILYSHAIVMPDQDVSLFDLIGVKQDPDACTPTTLTDNSV